MRGSTSAINFFIVLILIYGAYTAYQKNPEILKDFGGYLKNAQSEFTGFANNLSNFGGSFGGSSSDSEKTTTTTGKPVETMRDAVLPGTLTKLPTNNDKDNGSENDTVPARDDSVTLALTIKGIISETNKARAGQSLAALSESAKLNLSAKVKAQDILDRQYFEHVAPNGTTVGDLADDAGYAYLKIGENLALGNFKDDADVVTAWMNSPGHRANILDGQYANMGVGVAYGRYEGHMVYVAVQHFGRPSSACPAVSATLRASVEAGQKEVTDLAASLDRIKAQIDQRRANGEDTNDLVKIYNEGIDKYQSLYAASESLRIDYNAQVSAYNACIAGS